MAEILDYDEHGIAIMGPINWIGRSSLEVRGSYGSWTYFAVTEEETNRILNYLVNFQCLVVRRDYGELIQRQIYKYNEKTEEIRALC